MVTHDKPGSCGPPGNWLDHLDDRARETRAAVDVLRSQPEVEGPVGLFGVSQGAWVASIAAVSDPSSVDFIVSMSGPGVAVHEQDRYRIAVALRSADLPPSDVDDALAWIDERTRRLLDGESIHAIIDEQQRLADRPWAPIALEFFDHPVTLRYLSRILAFEPVPSLSRISCPSSLSSERPTSGRAPERSGGPGAEAIQRRCRLWSSECWSSTRSPSATAMS